LNLLFQGKFIAGKNSGHLPQKNYRYPVSCDACRATPQMIIFVGGGERNCVTCHLRKCKNCSVEAKLYE
jgi:hypothetical protein